MGISACLAGAVCGDHCSPISDTTIMASAGANCNHIDHVSTQIPYAVTVAAICFVNYILAAFIRNVVISLAIGVVMVIGTLLVIRSVQSRRPLERKGPRTASADKTLRPIFGRSVFIGFGIRSSFCPKLPECHGARRRHVERIHAVRHGGSSPCSRTRQWCAAKRPSPSVPSTIASRGSAASRASSMLTESSVSAIAAVRKPSACRRSTPFCGQSAASSPMRAHGT